MKRNWQPSELVEHWMLLPDELALLARKTDHNRLGFAVLFKFFQYTARFPTTRSEIPQSVIDYVARQLIVPPEFFNEYDWQGRTISTHRAQIREYFGFREATVTDALELTRWLETQSLAYDLNAESLKEAAYEHLRTLKIEPPTMGRLERLVRSAVRHFEEHFCQQTAQQLSKEVTARLDSLLSDDDLSVSLADGEEKAFPLERYSLLASLKTDPGRNSLESLQQEAAKLQQLRQLDLPEQLFLRVSPKVLQIYKQRVAVEAPSHLHRHPEPRRYTLMAAFCWLRIQEITDNLVELLIQIVHRIGARASRRVEKELLNDFKQVSGKTGLLFRLAEAAVEQPDGIVREVLYPVVGEQTLKNLVQEFKSTGTAYREKVYTVMRSSYGHHYRRLVPLILNLLEFRSNNDVHRPVIEALELLKKYTDSKQRYYAPTEKVPVEGVVPSQWRSLIIEENSEGEVKINRINYELAVLQSLRDGLRCKEIWVVGANRYRNPEQDLPTDFEEQRKVYYQALKQPTDAEEFIAKLQEQMQESLTSLDQGMPQNREVT